MVERPARLTGFETDGFTVDIPQPGTYRVRIRATPYWKVERGSACVGRTGDGWTEVSTDVPGEVEVRARFSPGARLADDPDCRT